MNRKIHTLTEYFRQIRQCWHLWDFKQLFFAPMDFPITSTTRYSHYLLFGQIHCLGGNWPRSFTYLKCHHKNEIIIDDNTYGYTNIQCSVVQKSWDVPNGSMSQKIEWEIVLIIMFISPKPHPWICGYNVNNYHINDGLFLPASSLKLQLIAKLMRGMFAKFFFFACVCICICVYACMCVCVCVCVIQSRFYMLSSIYITKNSCPSTWNTMLAILLTILPT